MGKIHYPLHQALINTNEKLLEYSCSFLSREHPIFKHPLMKCWPGATKPVWNKGLRWSWTKIKLKSCTEQLYSYSSVFPSSLPTSPKKNLFRVPPISLPLIGCDSQIYESCKTAFHACISPVSVNKYFNCSFQLSRNPLLWKWYARWCVHLIW